MSYQWIPFLFAIATMTHMGITEGADACKSHQKKVRIFAKPIGCNRPYTPKYRCTNRLTSFQRSYVLDEMPDHPESSYPGRREEFSDLLSR